MWPKSGTDHCQLAAAAGQNSKRPQAKNALFLRHFPTPSPSGVPEKQENQIKSDVRPNENQLGPEKAEMLQSWEQLPWNGMPFGARFPDIAVCPWAKLSCILNK